MKLNEIENQDNQMHADCIFCQIIAGKIATSINYENDHAIVIDDINPQAPIHKLIIPKKHIATVNDLNKAEFFIIGELFAIAKLIAHDCNICDTGYRLIINCEEGAGQTVFHIHLHLLGGKLMGWP